jgi:subtilase family serine protease
MPLQALAHLVLTPTADEHSIIEGSVLNRFALAQKATPALALSAILLASLTACGGGSGSETLAQPAAASDTSAQSTSDSALDNSAVATAMAQTEVQPSYHMAPALLDEPAQDDAGGTNASARTAPKSFDVDASVAEINTARLSRDVLVKSILEKQRARVAAAGSDTSTAPLTTTIKGTVYTPAQIRAAYGLSALPAAGTSLTTAQKAALGAGQTIYLIDAYHDATALSDLNAFSTKFGLPTCTSVAITSNAKLAAPPSNCTFSQVYSYTRGTVTTAVPAYNATWAPESKLDVQWAHAIAPLARIVLIEMPSAMSNAILDANTLAKNLGTGVVSMSFGSTEAGWASTTDSYFVGTGMTFVAAAGDSGAQVLWPAVSPNVLAVGGTSTNVSSTGSRIEVAWTGSGGGMSAYEALPAWQSGVTPAGGSALVRRAVPDVAFNASPMTGEYVAVTLPGKATTWSAYGGTSIAAPQWAGLVAVANGIRAANAKAALGDVHALIYKSIAAVPGTYASAMHDVIEGTNGTCATCKAGSGFDQTTGWGTPNASQLFEALTGVATAQAVTATAPTVPGGSFTGKVGSALSQSLNIVAPAGTTTSYALSGAPSGLAADTTGTLKWAAPVAGSYTFTATATTAAGKSASADYALKVIPGTAPAITSSSGYSGAAGSAFSATMTATNPNTGTLSYSISGAPSGLTASTAGALYWASPVAGSYAITAKVSDSYGYSSTKTVTLAISGGSTNHAPTVTAATLSEKSGVYFATRIAAKDADGDALTYSMSGAPAGLTLSSGLLGGTVSAKGTYQVTVTARDTHGATGSAVITLIVA